MSNLLSRIIIMTDAVLKKEIDDKHAFCSCCEITADQQTTESYTQLPFPQFCDLLRFENKLTG